MSAKIAKVTHMLSHHVACLSLFENHVYVGSQVAPDSGSVTIYLVFVALKEQTKPKPLETFMVLLPTTPN